MTAAMHPVITEIIDARTRRSGFTAKRPEFAFRPHPGHFIPTGVTTMHLGHMGTPQDAQLIAVSCLGCLVQYVVSGAGVESAGIM